MTVEIARHWRLKAQRYQLIGEVCPNCNEKIFPPRDVCPHCAGEATQPPFQFSGRGEVYSYTTVHNPPEGYEESAPYTVALVKLAEGPLITAQLTDVANNEVQIGMPVEMVTRKLHTQGDEGLIIYGYKFRPQLARA
jgi:uncharacterized OB-fold protein